MPSFEGYQFMVIACYDLSGWIKAKPVYILSFRAIADFYQEDIICKYSCFGKLIIDRGLENKDVVVELIQRYGIERVVVLAYYLQEYRLIKRIHKLTVNALSKILDGRSTNWVRNIPAVLWIYQSTVYISTGFTPITSVVETNLSFLLSWKLLPGKFYFRIKFTQLLIYQLCICVNYIIESIILKKRSFTVDR